MYPLKSVVIGCDEQVLPGLLMEFAAHSVELNGEFPDADSVIRQLRSTQQEMRLFIIQLKSRQGLEELKRLSGAFVGRPILALVAGGERDPELFFSANRSGATQILPLPLKSGDFKESLNYLAMHFSKATSDTRLIAVSGVTAACGATTVALNLAYEIALLHKLPCILVELSLQRGMLASYLNLQPRFTTHDLLRASERLDSYACQQALTSIADNLAVLAGPIGVLVPPTVSLPDVIRLVDTVKRLAKVVVLDIPYSYDDLFFKALDAAHQVLLVGEQKIPSVRALQSVLDILARSKSVRSYGVVINRYDARIEGFTVADLEKLLGVPKLMTVADDYAAVTAALNRGRPLRLQAPDSGALADIDALAQALLAPNHRPPVKTDGKSLVGRLIRTLRMS